MRLLLTGATGIVGAEIRDQLGRDARWDVTCVARKTGSDPGIVSWNMSGEQPPPALGGRWDAIVNCAADTRWSQTADEALRANVVSLEALAALAAPDTHVVHVSTAAVVAPGRDAGSTDPDDYRNMYEWSKAHAERVARQRFERLTIVRPPLVIGRRSDGRAARFAGMYMLLRGITSSSVPAVVGEPDAFFDTIPVDDAAAVIVAALDSPGCAEVLTPACGYAAPRVRTMVDLMCGALNEWRGERGADPVAVPPFLAPDSWKRFYRPFADDLLSRRQLLTLDHLDHFLPYLKLTEPFTPTHPVTGVEEAIAPSVRYWADLNPRLASLSARPWVAVARGDSQRA
ncbi:MAG TPA: SDR family oxidoreductase [Solirubrobacteraceae bacterium]|jgi:nucleoside-diphosphate-sugar epimerase|nr:SDR family oxidoreductase [Solirubrobacteraceae bacterium]